MMEVAKDESREVAPAAIDKRDGSMVLMKMRLDAPMLPPRPLHRAGERRDEGTQEHRAQPSRIPHSALQPLHLLARLILRQRARAVYVREVQRRESRRNSRGIGRGLTPGRPWTRPGTRPARRSRPLSSKGLGGGERLRGGAGRAVGGIGERAVGEGHGCGAHRQDGGACGGAARGGAGRAVVGSGEVDVPRSKTAERSRGER